MRLLVLGGTAFLGRAVARQARDAGYDVTCAARGETGPPPADVTFVRVDRSVDGGLAPLAGESFDAVVDVSSRPSQVRRAVAELGGRAGHWCYVSTGSVYSDDVTPDQRADSSPTVAAAPPEVDDPRADDFAAYGPCKVACEEAVLGAHPDAFICRAGLIVGPEDRSGRFTYWVDRLARGGEVLAPGRPDDSVQWVDVRDLAAWLIMAGETRLPGVYDGIGAPVPRADFLAGVARGVGVAAELTWVDQSFLTAHEVQPWMGRRSLPMWLPLPEHGGFLTRDVRASLAAGLATRDVAETAADTLTWRRTGPVPDSSDWPGLTADEEAELLALWHARTSVDEPGR
jgi:2'-hydroxyisoflavone reductase